MRVDFEDEYPDADASCTEAFATLLVAGNVLAAEHERRIEHTLGVSQSVTQALAVVDGAGRTLTPTEISERTLLASATAVLDTLERQGWIRRTPNPDSRKTASGTIMLPLLISMLVSNLAAAMLIAHLGRYKAFAIVGFALAIHDNP